MTDTSRPEVRAQSWGAGFHAHFKHAGGRWQFVRDPKTRRAAIYPTSEAAKDAATALVLRFLCPEIKATIADGESEDARIARALGADTFRQRRDDDDRQLRAQTFSDGTVRARKSSRATVVERVRRVVR